MTEAAATSDAKKLREDIALVRQYADTIICLLPNMMGVLDRCLAAAEAHERCGGDAALLSVATEAVRGDLASVEHAVREQKWRRLYSIEHPKGHWREIPGCECCVLRRELGVEQ
jgi:hypothetical protein